MAKRVASTELTRDNCEQDDPVEEPGHFAVATDEEIARRPTKSAKRRLAVDPKDGGIQKGGLFAGFKGLAGSAFSSKSASLGNETGGNFAPSTFTFGTASANNSVAASQVDSKVADATGNPAMAAEARPGEVNGIHGDGTTNAEFCACLSSLNRRLLNWVQQHIEENPYVDLSPVFHDYFKHMAKLEQDFNTQNVADTKTPKSADFTPLSHSASTVGSEDEKQPVSLLTAPGLNKQGSAAPSLSFGFASFTPMSSSAAAAVSAPFSFGKATPDAASFASSSNAGESSSSQEMGDDNEPYEPPKLETVELEEEGAVLTKKCKLFVKRKTDKNYAEKGIGTIYIKPSDGGKTQLLVRAGTALGNVLLNVLLSESVPCVRVGKNNVSLVCIPHPPLDLKQPESSEPATFLVRVKDESEADELIAAIDKHKMS